MNCSNTWEAVIHLVKRYFLDMAQLEVYGLVHHYNLLHSDTTPNRDALIMQGSQLPDEQDVFIGHYRSLNGPIIPLTVRSICQHYIQRFGGLIPFLQQ